MPFSDPVKSRLQQRFLLWSMTIGDSYNIIDEMYLELKITIVDIRPRLI